MRKLLLLFVIAAMAMCGTASADTWESNGNIITGLSNPSTYTTPHVFEIGTSTYLIQGQFNGQYRGFQYIGNTWQGDAAIYSGLGDTGDHSSPAVFLNTSTTYLISGNNSGLWTGFNWTGTAWQSDKNIVSGLTDVGSRASPYIFEMNNIPYLISGNNSGLWTGFNWTGTAWQSDKNIVSGLTDVGFSSSPSVFYKDSIWYLISGVGDGTFVGYNWTGTTWQSDNDIVSGLGDIGISSSPDIFEISNNWFIISGDFGFSYFGFSEILGTSISGYIHEGEIGSSIPISNVIISIYNSTWSNIVTSDNDGYYIIKNLENTTYTLEYKKDRYVSVHNQFVTPVHNQTYNKNIWMSKSTGEYYSRHYTSFTLKNIFGACYSNVDTVVYDNGAVEATGTTGTDGAVTFHLFEDVEYTLTFTNASQGVDESIVITPRDNAYIIYVTLLDFSLDDSATVWASVDYHWSKNRINTSHGWINFTYTDKKNSTWQVEYFINRSVNNSHNEPAYYFISSQNGTWIANSSYTVSTIVPADNATFVCHFSADNPNLPSLAGSGSAVINFVQGVMVDLGWEDTWKYNTAGIVLIIFVGLLFGAANAHIGAVVCVLTGWFLYYIGWLTPPEVSFVALSLATVLSILFVMRKGESLKA